MSRLVRSPPPQQLHSTSLGPRARLSPSCGRACLLTPLACSMFITVLPLPGGPAPSHRAWARNPRRDRKQNGGARRVKQTQHVRTRKTSQIARKRLTHARSQGRVHLNSKSPRNRGGRWDGCGSYGLFLIDATVKSRQKSPGLNSEGVANFQESSESDRPARFDLLPVTR